MRSKFVLGTRGSPLAMAQTRLVLGALRRAAPGTRFEVRVIRTTGDRLGEASLRRLSGRGDLTKAVFTKEIERELLAGRIDLAVHSMKDLPGVLPEGLCLGAVPRREDPVDVFVGRDGRPLARLPAGSVIGTSSPRRRAQLLARYPTLKVKEVRGNVGTRLAKLAAAGSPYAGLVLARAGMRRLGLRPRHARPIPPSTMIPAPGQGAIAVEIRSGDARTAKWVRRIHHARSGVETAAERALQARMGGGCRLPLGARATPGAGGRLTLRAVIATPDGRRVVRAAASGSAADPEGLAERVYRRLMASGGRRVMRALSRRNAV